MEEAAELGNYRIVDVGGSEYWIQAENPAALARVIRDFVAGRL